ncbi:MAG: TlpA disulfide reductase family protein [Candidatus Kapabacteria bacterium]|nr:TlpA disulfide reductase family protein [Candidatus Kapabacteria bacterium]
MRLFQRFTLVVAFILLAITIFECSSKKNEGQTDEKIVPRIYKIDAVKSNGKNKATDFRFVENGKESSFSEITKGKVVLLNFWGTWCPPCRAELPDIIQISKLYFKEQIIVIGVNMERDPATATETVKSFAEKIGIPYRLFISNPALEETYGGITGVPTTFIIDSHGNIAQKFVGMKTKQVFIDALQNAIKSEMYNGSNK